MFKLLFWLQYLALEKTRYQHVDNELCQQLFKKQLRTALQYPKLNTKLRACVFLMQQEEMPSGLKDPLTRTLTQNVRANSMSNGHGIKSL